MRLDKYLKVSRLIKRRTVANEACDNERVTVNGRVARASYDVKVGDVITIRFGQKALSVEVLSVADNVGKADAAAMYRRLFSLAYDRNDGGAMYHRLTMEGREKLTVAGVEDVERFDENCIVMSTCAGTLVVTGEGLHIGKLSLDGGELHVDGRIDGVNYEEEQPSRSGLFSRLFA